MGEGTAVIPHLVAPDVVRLRASKGEDPEPGVVWRVRLGSSSLEGEDPRTGKTAHFRPLIGYLRIDGPNGWGDIDVSALLMSPQEVPVEEMRNALQRSDAVETLFRYAKNLLLPVVVNVEDNIPRLSESPETEIDVFDLVDDSGEPQP